MRLAWAGLVACTACGRIGFDAIGDGTRDGVDAAPIGDPAVVMNVVPTGLNRPIPIWNGEAFVVVTSYFEVNTYRTYSETGVPLGAATTPAGIGYVIQAVPLVDGVAVLHDPSSPGSDLAIARIDRTGAVTSDVVVVTGATNARIAKNLERDELCVVWADPDGTSPQTLVRAARTTPTGTKIGNDLIVTTNNNVKYGRLDVGCRGDALYVLFTIEAGDFSYYLHSFDGVTTQLADTELLPATGRLNLFDSLLVGPSEPVIAHGRYAARIQVDSFDPAAPGPLAGADFVCAAQFASVAWDGRDVQLAASCFNATALNDTMYLMAVTSQGDVVRSPVAVRTSDVYGGGPTEIAISPAGHLAVGFTEWDANLETHQGFVGFLELP